MCRLDYRLLKTPNPLCPQCGGQLSATPLGPQCAACLFAVLAEDAPESPQGARVFGEYELLEELGRGGMGVVYRAWQPALQRSVALKMLLAGPFAAPEFAQRFRREAQAAARLQHPGIAAIYEAGDCDGQAYYTMELIEGRTLAALVREKLPPAREAAAILEKTARAVAHAHALGVLHRDLKPSNILLGADGEPKVADFGLARVVQDGNADGLTLSTTVLGSPPYMAPEQAGGRATTEATDVYALGAVLYELLTGRPPHQGSSPQEILTHVREAVIVEPRRLNPSLPRDLETVCLRCLEREPARRYQTAAALADDLARFLRGEPVRARPVSFIGKAWRWCRRRPAVAASLALAVVALVTAAAVSTAASVRMAESARRAQAAEKEATARLRESLLGQARAALSTQDGGRQFHTLELLRQAQALRPSPEVTRLALAALTLPDLYRLQDWQGAAGSAVRVSPRGDAWVGLTPEGEGCRVTVHRVTDGAVLAQLSGQPAADAVSLSADLSMVRLSSANGRLRVVRLTDGMELLEMEAAAAGAFSEDGSSLLVLDAASQLQRVELSTGRAAAAWQPCAAVPLFYNPPAHAVFSPDGKQVACAAPGLTTILILDAVTGARLREMPAPGALHALAWHPSRAVLAVACQGSVVVGDTRDGTTLAKWKTAETGEVLSVAFSPDGAMLATGGWDVQTRLYDWPRAALIVAAPGGGGVETFSADGRHLLSLSGSAVNVWKVAAGRGLHLLTRAASWPEVAEPLQTAAFDPTGRWLAAMNGPDIDWWTADGRRLAAQVPLTEDPAPAVQMPGRLAAVAENWLGLTLRPRVKKNVSAAQAIAFHPREAALIAATAEGLVSIPWKEENGVLTTGPPRLRWSEAGARLFSFCADGTRAAVWSPSASQPGGVRLRFLETTGTWRTTGGTDVYFAAPRGPRWSADGRWLTDHVWHGPAALVWDAQSGAVAWQSAITSSWAGPQWTPDDQLWCATGLGDQTFHHGPDWTLADDRPLPRSWNDFVNAAAFSPDGTLLATAPGSDGEIVLQQWPARTELLRWQPARGVAINAMWFSPDSRRLAFTTRDRRLRLWDIADSRAALEAAGFPPVSLPGKR